jgi:hypothetical protein
MAAVSILSERILILIKFQFSSTSHIHTVEHDGAVIREWGHMSLIKDT